MGVDEFDIHGLEHGKKDLILPSGDNDSGYIWYRHPINIVVLFVASSVLLMIIVSGLYAFKSCTTDAKHSKRGRGHSQRSSSYGSVHSEHSHRSRLTHSALSQFQSQSQSQSASSSDVDIDVGDMDMDSLSMD